MILIEEIEIEIYGKKVKHYESLGYDIPRRKGVNGKLHVAKGTRIMVKVEHLPPKSHEIVPYKCDYCNENGIKPYKDITRGREIVSKDCCENCIPVKKRDICLIKYGVEHMTQLESTKIKMKETNLKVRGVAYPLQSSEVKRKVENTFLEKYGETSCLKNEEIKKKISNTNLERYGVTSPIQNVTIKNKIIKTNRIKYGVDNPQQNKEIREKTMKTLINIGHIPCSIQQRYIHRLVGGKINYQQSISTLDIAFPEEKIYIEYDGSGHWLSVAHGTMTEKEFELKEIRRSYALQTKGWKEMRIISRKDKLPIDDKIIEMFNFAKEYLNTGRHFIKFDIDNSKVISSQFEKEYDFGILKKIKQLN